MSAPPSRFLFFFFFGLIVQGVILIFNLMYYVHCRIWRMLKDLSFRNPEHWWLHCFLWMKPIFNNSLLIFSASWCFADVTLTLRCCPLCPYVHMQDISRNLEDFVFCFGNVSAVKWHQALMSQRLVWLCALCNFHTGKHGGKQEGWDKCCLRVLWATADKVDEGPVQS